MLDSFVPSQRIILTVSYVLLNLSPIVVFHDKTSLKEKFIADEIAESKTREPGLFGRIFMFLAPTAYFLLLLFVIGSWLDHTASKAEAVTKEEYMVLAEQPPIATIRIYPDLIIGMPFDRTTKEVQPRLVLRKIGGKDINVNIAERIGFLKLREPDKTKKSSE